MELRRRSGGHEPAVLQLIDIQTHGVCKQVVLSFVVFVNEMVLCRSGSEIGAPWISF